MANKKLAEYIYTSVPDKNIQKGNYDRQIVLGILFDARGAFVTAPVIAKKIGWPTRGTQIEVRKAVTELIEIDGQPIISGSEGFALTTNPEQLKAYGEQLESRRQGLQRRINKIWEIYDRLVYERRR